MLNQKKQTKIQKRIKISNFFAKHFYIIPVLDIFVLIWFSLILPFGGAKFKLLVDNTLTKSGWLFSSIVVIIPLIMTLIKACSDKAANDDDSKERAIREADLYKTLLRSFLNICDKKAIYLANKLSYLKNSQKNQSLNPMAQLEEIIKQLKTSLSFLLSDEKNRIDTEEMYVNILCNFDDSEKWIAIPGDQRGISKDELMRENSFFTYIKNINSCYDFNNNKQDLYEVNHYIKDERDTIEDGKLLGSILGYRIQIRTEQHKIMAILFVSTFERKFINAEDKTYISNVRNNIKNIILKQFEPRIRIELCNLYFENNRNNSADDL